MPNSKRDDNRISISRSIHTWHMEDHQGGGSPVDEFPIAEFSSRLTGDRVSPFDRRDDCSRKLQRRWTVDHPGEGCKIFRPVALLRIELDRILPNSIRSNALSLFLPPLSLYLVSLDFPSLDFTKSKSPFTSLVFPTAMENDC